VELQRIADERIGSREAHEETYERTRTESQDQTASISDLTEPPERLEQTCVLGELQQGEQTKNQDPIAPAGEVVELQRIADERIGSREAHEETYERTRTESQDQTASISDLTEPPEKLEQNCVLGELQQVEQTETQDPIAPNSEVLEPERTGSRELEQEADELTESLNRIVFDCEVTEAEKKIYEQKSVLMNLQEGADESTKRQDANAPDSAVVEAQEKADELSGKRETQEETDERTESQAKIAHNREAAEPRAMQEQGHDQTESRNPMASDSAAAELLEEENESQVLWNSTDHGGDGPGLLKEAGEQTQSQGEIKSQAEAALCTSVVGHSGTV